MMARYLLIALCALPMWLGAQAASSRLLLRGGSVIQGTVLDVDDPNYFHVRLSDADTTLLVPRTVVQRLIPAKGDYKLLAAYDIAQRGWYKSVGVSYLAGLKYARFAEDNLRQSVSVHAEVGYYLRDWYAVGLGIGADQYDEWLVPIYAHVLLIRPNRINAPYFSLQGGRSIAVERVFSREDGDVSRGRWMWYPSVGVRFASRGRASVYMDVGYKFQHLRVEQNYDDLNQWQWWWWGRVKNVKEDRQYKSFVARVGMTF